MSPTSEPNHNQSLREELQRPKAEQDKAMALAIYGGISKEEATLYDKHRKSIYELYKTLFDSASPKQTKEGKE